MAEQTQNRISASRAAWWIALLAVSIIGMAAIGIMHRYLVQPQEPGWAEGGPARWESPLSIGTDLPRYKQPLRMAVDRINGQVGCGLLEISESPTITIEEGTVEVGATSKDWAAGAWHAKDWSYGRIVIYQPLMVGTDMTVIWHEIGEIFNLAHDRAWVMRPVTEEAIGGGLVVPRFSDKDAALLNEAFCPRSTMYPLPSRLIP